MNPDKTEAIVIGISARQRSEEGPAATIDLGSDSVKLSATVRSLGVTIDDMLSFNEHVDSVCKLSNFHLRPLRHIRNYISEDMPRLSPIPLSTVD